MINGTLTEWRKNWKPDVIEIHRMVRLSAYRTAKRSDLFLLDAENS